MLNNSMILSAFYGDKQRTFKKKFSEATVRAIVLQHYLPIFFGTSEIIQILDTIIDLGT
jgi:hypothetical protein